MLVAGLFGLDGVPGDAGGLELFGGAVEVGEGDAGGGEGGDLIVLEVVDGAGVVEDTGDVGGEEELAVSEAENDGRAHAGGDHLVGLMGGEDADGEGAGHALGGAADGFFERDGGGVGAEDGFRVAFEVDGAGAGRGGLRAGEFEFVLDDVGDDFGVGFGEELVALGDEGVFEG